MSFATEDYWSASYSPVDIPYLIYRYLSRYLRNVLVIYFSKCKTNYTQRIYLRPLTIQFALQSYNLGSFIGSSESRSNSTQSILFFQALHPRVFLSSYELRIYNQPKPKHAQVYTNTMQAIAIIANITRILKIVVHVSVGIRWYGVLSYIGNLE